MVRRFYATLEVNMVNETIKWMTGKGKFKATFREFPCACGLDYDLTKGGAQMKELPEVKEDEAPWFHKGKDDKFLWSKGLRRESSVLNSMLYYMVIPKGGDAGRIRTPYYIAIRAIMDGVLVNWVDYLVEEMLECKHNLKYALAYQSYIMALVKSKASF
jgi:hypothetical protein